MSKKWVLGALLAFAVGCGGSDGKSPSQMCRDFSSDFCGQLADCQVEAGGVSQAEANEIESECLAELNEGIRCSDVVDTTDSVDACFDDIAARSCDEVLVNTIPNSCRGVFLVEE